jgi:hypothetical protein
MKLNALINCLIVLVIIITGCSKNDQNNISPNLVKTDYLGCLQEYGNTKSTTDSDTLFYDLVNDTLLLHVSMFQNCGYCLKDSVIINNDLVNIFISDTCGLVADCWCDFKFDYYFADLNDPTTFTVYYKAFGEPSYSIWRILSYPE